VLEEFRARYGHTILERYGMSETLMIMSNPYAGERRPGSVGLPLPGISVLLLNPGGTPAGDGETGEIYLRGPNVFSAYWRREEPPVRRSWMAISAPATSRCAMAMAISC
jgi:malonyl-CoA/methylmalonyl-CoA synthetase